MLEHSAVAPSMLKENFQSAAADPQYYDFNDVDVDRYTMSQRPGRVLMVSAREVTQNQITGAGKTWQNQHLVYTHGFGVVAAQVNTTTAEGRPASCSQDIPPQATPRGSRPASDLLRGEPRTCRFVVVRRHHPELDYRAPRPRRPYHGAGGISLGDIFGEPCSPGGTVTSTC